MKYGVKLVPGFYHYGGGGLGLPVASIPQTGETGGSYLANEAADPANAGKEIRGLILTSPAGFSADEYGAFSLTGAADGTYTFTYQTYLDGADGGIGTGTIIVGVACLIGNVSIGDYILSGAVTMLVVTAPLPLIGAPISDTGNTGWLASAGISLYATIDEVVADDSDYIYASSAGNTCQIALSNTTFPGAISQVVEFRASSPYGNTVQVRLKNTGGGTVATWTQVLSTTPTTYRKALTAAEIALITSGALSLELTAI